MVDGICIGCGSTRTWLPGTSDCSAFGGFGMGGRNFPTPKGIVKIRHEKQPDGSISSKIDAPEGIVIK